MGLLLRGVRGRKGREGGVIKEREKGDIVQF